MSYLDADKISAIEQDFARTLIALHCTHF